MKTPEQSSNSPSKRNERYSFAYQSGAIAVATAMAKAMGLIRDIVVAKSYGTSIVADAYYYVQLVTNNWFLTLGTVNGPIDSSVVSVLADKGELQRAPIVAKIIQKMVFNLCVVSLIGYILAPLIIPWFAGFYQPRSHSLTSPTECRLLFSRELLTQFCLTLPMIILGAIIGVLYGIARLKNKVVLPSLAPTISSLIIILIVIPAHGWGIKEGWPLAAGCLIGALMQLLIQLPGYYSERVRTSTEQPDVDKSVAEFKKVALPALFSMSLGYLTIFVDSTFAIGLGTGAWTAVAYSNRLVQLPLGILSMSLLIPMFPRFALAASNSDTTTLQQDLHKCLKFIWFVTLPIMAMFSALAEPIVRVLFEGDQFTAASVRIVTIALTFLAPQMVFSLGRELLTQVFWAFRDAIAPFRLACVALVCKIVLDGLFVWVLRMDVAGISLAGTCMSAINFTTLIILLGRRMPLNLIKLARPLTAMLLAAMCSHILAVTTYARVGQMLGAGRFSLLCSLIAAIILAGLGYLSVCWALRLNEVEAFFELVRHTLSRIRPK